MGDHMSTLGALTSVFQLTAGVALAMSVFRAPYEYHYQRLGAILDREERLLDDRTDDVAVDHSDRVLQARIGWLGKGGEIEEGIRRREGLIRASILISTGLLIVASIWPDQEVGELVAAGLIVVVLGPLLWGWASIVLYVRKSLAGVKSEVEGL